MSITTVITVYCEHQGCKARFANSAIADSVRGIRAAAKSEGWSRVGGKDYCPDHKPTYKRVLVPAE